MQEIKIVNKLSILGKTIPKERIPEGMFGKTFLWEEISLENRKTFSEAMQISAMGNCYKRRTA